MQLFITSTSDAVTRKQVPAGGIGEMSVGAKVPATSTDLGIGLHCIHASRCGRSRWHASGLQAGRYPHAMEGLTSADPRQVVGKGEVSSAFRPPGQASSGKARARSQFHSRHQYPHPRARPRPRSQKERHSARGSMPLPLLLRSSPSSSPSICPRLYRGLQYDSRRTAPASAPPDSPVEGHRGSCGTGASAAHRSKPVAS